jgi:hypothetical protein
MLIGLIPIVHFGRCHLRIARPRSDTIKCLFVTGIKSIQRLSYKGYQIVSLETCPIDEFVTGCSTIDAMKKLLHDDPSRAGGRFGYGFVEKFVAVGDGGPEMIAAGNVQCVDGSVDVTVLICFGGGERERAGLKFEYLVRRGEWLLSE